MPLCRGLYLHVASILFGLQIIPELMPCAVAQSTVSLKSGVVATPSQAIPATAIPPEELGAIQLARGEYVAALSTLQGIGHPSAKVLNYIGVAYNRLYAPEAALKAYRRAIELNPGYAEAYNNEGVAYQEQLNYSAAVKAYKHAVRSNNMFACAYRNLATAYMSQGKYSKGKVALRKALKLDPDMFGSDQPPPLSVFGTVQQRIEIALRLAEVFCAERNLNLALAQLKKASSLGFNDRKRLLRDPDLRLLRDFPEFQVLLREMNSEAIDGSLIG